MFKKHQGVYFWRATRKRIWFFARNQSLNGFPLPSGFSFEKILIKLPLYFQGHCFGGSGYFGVGAPQFFYASIDALTLGKIIRLLGFTFQIPPPIAETGFPEGASVSIYSMTVSRQSVFLVSRWLTGWSFIVSMAHVFSSLRKELRCLYSLSLKSDVVALK